MACNCNNNSNRENMMISPTIDENAVVYDRIVLPTLSQLGKGAIGATKAILNIDVLPINIINKRRDICKSCEFNNKNGTASQCIKCNCLIILKVKLTRESCPENKW